MAARPPSSREYWTLAVDPTQFNPAIRFQKRAPCTELLEDIQALAVLSTQRTRGRSRWFAMGCGSLLLAMAVPPVIYALLSWPDPTPGWPLVFAPTLGIMGLIAFIARSQQAPFELETRRHELITQVLGMLRADIAPGEPVTLELDPRPETHADKSVGSSTNATGWKIQHYLDPWWVLQGRLMDGTGFRLDVTERIEQRSRWARGSSGKYKHKTKRVSDAFIRVRLRVKPERYPHLTRISAAARGAMKLPQGTRLKALSVEADRVDMTVLVERPWMISNDITWTSRAS